MKGLLKKYTYNLEFVLDHLKTQEMCERAVEKAPYTLKCVPDYLKTQGMCIKAVEKYPLILIFVPDWFVTREGVHMWYDEYYDDNGDYWVTEGNNDDKFFEWYDEFKKWKVQKAKIKEELMPIAWHPSRWWDWCIPEDEKKGTENLRA